MKNTFEHCFALFPDAGWANRIRKLAPEPAIDQAVPLGGSWRALAGPEHRKVKPEADALAKAKVKKTPAWPGAMHSG